MDYSKLSDFEINTKVAKSILNYEDLAHVPLSGTSVVQWGDGCNWHHFDPCNNAADAWPIIQEAGISIAYDGDEWAAIHHSRASRIEKHPNKPFRAALILWLMMQEGE